MTPLSVWSVTKLGLVAAAWIALVAIVGPRLGPRSSVTAFAPDGSVQFSGVAYPARRDLYVVLAAFGPPILLLVAWWLQRR